MAGDRRRTADGLDGSSVEVVQRRSGTFGGFDGYGGDDGIDRDTRGVGVPLAVTPRNRAFEIRGESVC